MVAKRGTSHPHPGPPPSRGRGATGGLGRRNTDPSEIEGEGTLALGSGMSLCAASNGKDAAKLSIGGEANGRSERSSLHRRSSRMPGRGLLIGIGNLQQEPVFEGAPPQLQADG
jgi:hypothetical protein